MARSDWVRNFSTRSVSGRATEGSARDAAEAARKARLCMLSLPLLLSPPGYDWDATDQAKSCLQTIEGEACTGVSGAARVVCAVIRGRCGRRPGGVPPIHPTPQAYARRRRD